MHHGGGKSGTGIQRALRVTLVAAALLVVDTGLGWSESVGVISVEMVVLASLVEEHVDVRS